MTKTSKRRAKPRIAITSSDANRLTVLASTMTARMPDIADDLMIEIERARIVKNADNVDGVVGMGSTVMYETGGDTKSVTLVWPGEADIAEGKISVMTPVGVALIGLSAGQAISWEARDGRSHTLTVKEVVHSVPALAFA